MSTDIIAFGKHKGKTYYDLVEDEPDYCEWLVNQVDIEKTNNGLFSFLIKNQFEVDKNYNNKKKQETQEYKAEFFSFGKHKGESIKQVYETDEKYCKHIIDMPNVLKFHAITVLTIKQLIADDKP